MVKVSKQIWIMTASLYITQYIGVAFVMTAMVAIMRQEGSSLQTIASLNLVAIPLLGKIFYAPLVDRYRLFFQGQYRSWLLCAQGLMAVTLLMVSFLDYHHDLPIMLALLVVYVIATSFQDVSIDGLACKLFDHSQRKFANSIQFSGNLGGNIIGGGLLLIFYPWLHWKGCLWVLFILTAISWIQLVAFKETKEIEVQSNGVGFWQSIKSFVSQHKSWFKLLLLYPLGFTGVFGILTPMLVDANWSLGKIGFATKVFGSLVGVLSALCASGLIYKFGRQGTLTGITFIFGIAISFMLPITIGYTQKFTVYLAISMYFIVFPAFLATIGTMIMDRASKTAKQATFFSLQFSLFSVLGFIYAGIYTALAQSIGYTAIIVISMIIMFTLSGYLFLHREKLN